MRSKPPSKRHSSYAIDLEAPKKKERVSPRNPINLLDDVTHPVNAVIKYPSILNNLRGVSADVPLHIEDMVVVRKDFMQLPVEVASHVLSYLTAPDLCRSGRVSQLWRSLCEDQSLWKDKYSRSKWKIDNHYLQTTINHLLDLRPDDDTLDFACYDPSSNQFDWKDMYRHKYSQMQNWYHNRYREYSFHVPGRPVHVNIFHGKFMILAYDLGAAGPTERRVFKLKIYDLTSVTWPSHTNIASLGERSPSKISTRTVVSSLIEWKSLEEEGLVLVKEDETIRCLAVDENSGCLVPRYEIGVRSYGVEGVHFVKMCVEGNRFHCFTTDGVLRSWEVKTGHLLNEITTDLHLWSLSQVIAHGKWVAVLICNNKIAVYNTVDGVSHPARVFFADPDQKYESQHLVHKILISSHQREDVLYASLHTGSISRFDLQSGNPLPSLVDHVAPTRDIISGDSRDIFSSSEDGTVKMWEGGEDSTKNPSTFIVLHQHLLNKTNQKGQIVHMSAADHRLMALSHFGKIKLWDTTTGNLLFSIGYRNLTTAIFNDLFLVAVVGQEIVVRDFRPVPENLGSPRRTTTSHFSLSPPTSPPLETSPVPGMSPLSTPVVIDIVYSPPMSPVREHIIDVDKEHEKVIELEDAEDKIDRSETNPYYANQSHCASVEVTEIWLAFSLLQGVRSWGSTKGRPEDYFDLQIGLFQLRLVNEDARPRPIVG
ncbi:hypothetical protein PROFUN_07701 [Planoprotostelium fungivorum]|uniref:F-box domain-containing protein n=1 Tax=Planoprotostelium fungivorum TaxID=1890364 RepID=A0A2P6MM81_9EUKA|nr:hypothetical protein PROFUN_07701 [Planoprotostelium fungivorum]